MATVRPLDTLERRVLGALLEKEQATPDYYPLTLNALVQACNQKSNREPVMALTHEEVSDALERLRRDVLVWRSDGARAVRWEHRLSRRLGLAPEAKALLTLLLLRGPQTPGELRSRSDRLHSFSDVDQVEAALRALAGRSDPLAKELPRQPGQREQRWVDLLSPLEPSTEAAPTGTAPAFDARPSGEASLATGLEERVARLEEEVAQLAARLERLTREPT